MGDEREWKVRCGSRTDGEWVLDHAPPAPERGERGVILVARAARDSAEAERDNFRNLMVASRATTAGDVREYFERVVREQGDEIDQQTSLAAMMPVFQVLAAECQTRATVAEAQRDRLAVVLREIAAEFVGPEGDRRTYAGPDRACEKIDALAAAALSVLDRETPDARA